MDTVRIDIDGDRQTGIRFEEFPDVLYDDLKTEIDSLTLELFGRIEAKTPSRSGRLRSQERMKLFTDKESIKGSVFIAGTGSGSKSDFAKAGALEYGSHKRHKVQPHAMKLDHLWSRKLEAPMTVMVEAFDRTPHGPEFAFERQPLEAMRPEILSRLNAVVERAAAKADA